MTLTLSQPRRFEQTSDGLPFSIDKMRGGYSVLGKESGEFQKFSKYSKQCKTNRESVFYVLFTSLYELKKDISQLIFTCSKSTIETPEK